MLSISVRVRFLRALQDEQLVIGALLRRKVTGWGGIIPFVCEAQFQLIAVQGINSVQLAFRPQALENQGDLLGLLGSVQFERSGTSFPEGQSHGVAINKSWAEA